MPHSCTSQSIISAFKTLFSEQGIPDKVMSDNGKQYDCERFKTFAATWGFTHTTSSSHFSQSNGFVERTIQTVKTALQKAKVSGKDPDMALLCIRSTPIDPVVPSPAEMLLHGRKIKGNLPVKTNNTLAARDQIHARLQQRQQNQKMAHDKHAHDLPPLYPGQELRVQDQNSK